MRKNFRLIALTFFPVVLLFVGCQKQRSPSLGSDYYVSDLDRLKACRNTTFVENLLDQQVLTDLFSCLRWDTEFPKLFSAIKKTSASSWNQVFGPINKELINNRQVRDALISRVKKLDEEGALDDLSKVVTALNDTNFFDGLREVFNCLEEKNKCLREERKLKKQELLSILELVAPESDTVTDIVSILNNLIESIIPNANGFKNEVRKFYKSESFQKNRVDFVSVASNVALTNDDLENDKEFIISLLNKEIDGRNSLLEIFNKEYTNERNLIHLIQFPVKEELQLDRDFKVLNILRKNNYKCELKEDRFADWEISKTLNQTLEKQLSQPKQEFYKSLLELSHVLKTTSVVCPELFGVTREIQIREIERGDITINKKNHTLNIGKFLSDYGKYLNNPLAWSTLGLMIDVASKTKGGIGYLTEIAGNDIVHVLLNLQRGINNSDATLERYYIPIIKNFSNSEIEILKRFVNKYFKNIQSVKGLAKLWNFYSFEEKNFIFHYIDKHFEEDVNYPALLTFYLDGFSIGKGIFTRFGQDWLANEELKDKTISSMGEVVTNLAGQEVLGDLSRLISRDYILKIVEILSKGIRSSGLILANISSEKKENLIRATPIRSLVGDESDDVEAYVSCLKMLEDKEHSFYDYLKTNSGPCASVVIKKGIGKTLNYLNEFGVKYQSSFENTESSGHLLDNKGLLSEELIKLTTIALDILDKAIPGKNLTTVMDRLKFYFLNYAYKGETLNSLIMGLMKRYDQLDYSHSQIMKTFRKKINEMIIAEDKKTNYQLLLSNFAKILDDYSRYTNRKIENLSNLKFQCRSELNQKLNTNPCPSPVIVKTGLRKVAEALAEKQDIDSPTAINLMLKAMSPSEGILIPYESKKQRKYIITLDETIRIMYEMTDKEMKKSLNGTLIYPNKKEIEIREINDDRKEKTQKEILTTAERIETVIRDIRFDHNYLGVHYKNAVAKAEDYNLIVSQKHSVLKFCVGLGFCGKFFSRKEKRMAENSVATYPGLLEANTIFNRGNWMQALLGIFVGSSSKDSQKSEIFSIGNFEVPMLQTKEQLLKHNGRVVTELSMLALFSNGGRFFRDRIGLDADIEKNRTNFNDWINGKRFQAFSKSFMYGFSSEKMEPVFKKILHGLTKQRLSDGRDGIDLIVNWFSGLSDNELVKVENLLGKILYLSAYIGPPSEVKARFNINEKNNNDLYLDARYKNNNLAIPFEFLGEVADKWPIYYRVLGNSNLKEFLFENEDLIEFLIDTFEKEKEKLTSSSIYSLFNELFYFSTRILAKSDINLAGLVSEISSSESQLEKLNLSFRKVIDFFTHLRRGEEGKSRILEVSLAIKAISESRLISLAPFIEYLNVITKEYVESSNGIIVPSVHFDEPNKINRLLVKNNFEEYLKFISTLMNDAFNDLLLSLQDLFSAVEFKIRGN